MENNTSIENKLPVVISVNRVEDGQVVEKINVRGYLLRGKSAPTYHGEQGCEWHAEISADNATAATYVLTDADAKKLAAEGVDAGFWGGYHADIIKYATHAGLLVK